LNTRTAQEGDDMPTGGYDVFYTEPDTVDEMYCKVCATLCDVKRSVFGPTGFAESMAKRGYWHDRLICPHSGKSWHIKALQLAIEIDQTHSKRLAALIRLDREDFLRENGCL
jgi:hypothetical protein